MQQRLDGQRDLHPMIIGDLFELFFFFSCWPRNNTRKFSDQISNFYSKRFVRLNETFDGRFKWGQEKD